VGGPRRTTRFEGRTRYLRRLRCHASALAPGAGYPPDRDPYDVALVILRGTLETLGRRVGPGAVVFCAAGEPHDLRNVGSDEARYLVLELEGSAGRLARWAPVELLRLLTKRLVAVTPRFIIERMPGRLRRVVRRFAP
jgi:mannose-6-phosphate isomerase-like protein (cupin superfamily)